MQENIANQNVDRDDIKITSTTTARKIIFVCGTPIFFFFKRENVFRKILVNERIMVQSNIFMKTPGKIFHLARWRQFQSECCRNAPMSVNGLNHIACALLTQWSTMENAIPVKHYAFPNRQAPRISNAKFQSHISSISLISLTHCARRDIAHS